MWFFLVWFGGSNDFVWHTLRRLMEGYCNYCNWLQKQTYHCATTYTKLIIKCAKFPWINVKISRANEMSQIKNVLCLKGFINEHYRMQCRRHHGLHADGLLISPEHHFLTVLNLCYGLRSKMVSCTNNVCWDAIVRITPTVIYLRLNLHPAHFEPDVEPSSATQGSESKAWINTTSSSEETPKMSWRLQNGETYKN